MNEEIKEILDRLDFNEWEVDLYKVPITWCELYNIRDYITNLQQENEKLQTTANNCKQENKRLKQNQRYHKNGVFSLEYDKETLKDMVDDYKTRIDKAIEYIMTELITEWDIKNDGYVSGSDLPVDAITPILNILNGSD